MNPYLGDEFMAESLLSFSEVLIYGRVIDDLDYDPAKKKSRGKGNNKHLDEQLANSGNDEAKFAKIYGFAYEGTYYDLPEPVIFLVHGDGQDVAKKGEPPNQASRAPTDPSIGGVAAADYQVADGIKFWSYDKSDQTMRMDVMTGQFEQVLLDLYFGFDSPAISGAKVSGAKVSGAKVSGAKVSGAKVSGAKVSGAKVRGGD
ncbi:pentapeptide repeat-containing protein [Ruegeria faecimaris]|uniref:pentapeptide repeat-containing protein n=1 Tax=Ruegeria faecimaris TaxID=686389 RepID=UPI00249166E6|nr:pentapeptide repeat-containing protein [Ruegeria faecimaris]